MRKVFLVLMVVLALAGVAGTALAEHGPIRPWDPQLQEWGPIRPW